MITCILLRVLIEEEIYDMKHSIIIIAKIPPIAIAIALEVYLVQIALEKKYLHDLIITLAILHHLKNGLKTNVKKIII